MSRVPGEVKSTPFLQLLAIIRLTLCMCVCVPFLKEGCLVCVNVKVFFCFCFFSKQTNMNDYVFYPDNQQHILHWWQTENKYLTSHLASLFHFQFSSQSTAVTDTGQKAFTSHFPRKTGPKRWTTAAQGGASCELSLALENPAEKV